MSVDFIKAK
jgi:hypothetical protein